MKYIDAEKLMAEIERRLERYDPDYTNAGSELKEILSFVTSLQQDEKAIELIMCNQAYWEDMGYIMIPPNVTLRGIETLLKQVRKKLQQEQLTLPGIEDPGIPGKDFIPVEWVDACEMYGKWKIVKQEQPEVDLEKEAVSFCFDNGINISPRQAKNIARYFYELGLNARKG